MTIYKTRMKIQRMGANMRKAIPMPGKLIITLRFLLTEESSNSLKFLSLPFPSQYQKFSKH